MHILGGRWKGKRLVAPNDVRPTQSVVREAVFNICQWQIENATFLDLFAGSGAMGLEALSRGAALSVFVERHCEELRDNIRELHAEKQTYLCSEEMDHALERLKNYQFDLVYIDPPYQDTIRWIEPLCIQLHKFAMLKPDAIVFVESASRGPELAELYGTLVKKKSRRFGFARLDQFHTQGS